MRRTLRWLPAAAAALRRGARGRLRVVLRAGARREVLAAPAAAVRRNARHRGRPDHAGGPQEARVARERARRARDRGPSERPGGGGRHPCRRRRGEDRRDRHRDRLRVRRRRLQPILLRAGVRVGAARGRGRGSDPDAGRPVGLPREDLPGRECGRVFPARVAPVEPSRGRTEGRARARDLHRGLQGRLGAGVRVRGAAAGWTLPTARPSRSPPPIARASSAMAAAARPGVSVRDRQVRQEGRPPRRFALREGVRPRRSAGLLQRRGHGRRRASRPARSRPRRREVRGGLLARQRHRLHEPRRSSTRGARA